ncbi:unnamed protein product [Acanthosepion pharaonis]|uniref:Uncharacterized protein n=1 Tax=Acanthosepion pharaonis TaxID=158019 RepID=A0A812E1P0_ACAPH|nr:unnamed protein product [Sepia pharaonis]
MHTYTFYKDSPLSLSLFLSLSHCLSLSLSISLCLSLCLSVCLSLCPRRSRPCTLYITSVATTRSNGPVSSSDLVDDDSTPTGSVHVRSGQRLHCRPRFARVTSSAPMPGEDDQNPTVFRRKSPNKFSVGEAADRSLTSHWHFRNDDCCFRSDLFLDRNLSRTTANHRQVQFSSVVRHFYSQSRLFGDTMFFRLLRNAGSATLSSPHILSSIPKLYPLIPFIQFFFIRVRTLALFLCEGPKIARKFNSFINSFNILNRRRIIIFAAPFVRTFFFFCNH